MLKTKNFGRKSLNEIKEILTTMGLGLGMRLDHGAGVSRLARGQRASAPSEDSLMRHRVAHRKLGRVTEHRIAMLRNQASALIEHERIETTVARAKELRPFVEKIITVAKRSLERARTAACAGVNARRPVAGTSRTARSSRSCSTRSRRASPIAPGGYTRLLRLGYRRGDSAEVAQVELIGSEFDPNAKAAVEADKAEERRPREAEGERRWAGDPRGGSAGAARRPDQDSGLESQGRQEGQGRRKDQHHNSRREAGGGG